MLAAMLCPLLFLLSTLLSVDLPVFPSSEVPKSPGSAEASELLVRGLLSSLVPVPFSALLFLGPCD